MKDFTADQGNHKPAWLGFIQSCSRNQRMHVWHPDLRAATGFEHSGDPQSSLSFHVSHSQGRAKNQRSDIEIVGAGAGGHMLISHNGPRSEKGGRLSYPVAESMSSIAGESRRTCRE